MMPGMTQNDLDPELIGRLASLIEERSKKAYQEGYDAGHAAGWTAAVKSVVDHFSVEGPAPAPATEANNFEEFVAEIAGLISARVAHDLPDGVTAEDLGYADVKRVRQAIRHLTMIGQIRRVEKGRYLPVENQQPEQEAAAE